MDVPARIQVDGGEVVRLEWDDGTVTRLPAPSLRAACACATCREPSGAAETKRVLNGEVPVRIADVKLVGAYAINFVFTPDDHHTGIYPFDRLKVLGQEAPS